MNVPEILHALGGVVLQAEILSQSIHGSDRLRRGPVPLQPGGNAVIGELRMIADTRAVDVGILKRAVRARHHLNDDR